MTQDQIVCRLASAGIAAVGCLLAGCASQPADWRTQTIAVAPATAAPPLRRAPCPAIDPAITAEAQRLTPIAGVIEPDALTAALMGSEAAKNASLARLARAYEKCWRS
jgi:type IV pilus biogenesis protein CpaD/CtpE